MSFVADDPNDPNSNQSQVDKATQSNAAPQAASDDPSVSATPSGSGAGGVVSGGSPSSTPDKPSSSGSWTNLNSYLSANADQGAKLGGDIAQTVNNQGQQAQNDISTLGSNFNNQVQANTVNYDQAGVSKAINDATSLKAGSSLDPNELSGYQAQANASYGGPTDVTKDSNYGGAVNDINNTQNLLQQTQSEAGRGVLLNNQYKNSSANGYNQGENKLDQLLLENTQGAQQALQPLAQQWGGLNAALGNTVSSGAQAATQAQATDAATAQQAQQALASGNTNFQNQVNDGLAKFQASQPNTYNALMADLKSGNLSATDYKALGIDPNEHNYLQVDRARYLQPGVAATLGNYANQDQYTQALALAQLAGKTDSDFLHQGNYSNAGSALTSPAYTYNNVAESQDQARRAIGYQEDSQGLLDQINRSPAVVTGGAGGAVTQNNYANLDQAQAAFQAGFGIDPNSPYGQLYQQIQNLKDSYGFGGTAPAQRGPGQQVVPR